ncbi:unnamed protein product [Acanthoscelides obtectus]|uniref:Uncharacterized protein n=1 Tax=Acanthoscelides obtectus TaxID=200917 RepID=A0A9P0P0S3_ACAOB|nr:unnamed protein product [Acanthoscelides obtectus]CAK1669726.1 hypothetical protein AOBTE_LOCUS27204 [Acanthoscelides obtectus]
MRKVRQHLHDQAVIVLSPEETLWNPEKLLILKREKGEYSTYFINCFVDLANSKINTRLHMSLLHEVVPVQTILSKASEVPVRWKCRKVYLLAVRSPLQLQEQLEEPLRVQT